MLLGCLSELDRAVLFLAHAQHLQGVLGCDVDGARPTVRDPDHDNGYRRMVAPHHVPELGYLDDAAPPAPYRGGLSMSRSARRSRWVTCD